MGKLGTNIKAVAPMLKNTQNVFTQLAERNEPNNVEMLVPEFGTSVGKMTRLMGFGFKKVTKCKDLRFTSIGFFDPTLWANVPHHLLMLVIPRLSFPEIQKIGVLNREWRACITKNPNFCKVGSFWINLD